MKKKIEKKIKKIFKKKSCRLCKDKVESIDYIKEIGLLSRFISDRARIVGSRLTGNCAKHQRMVANGVKRARIAGLVPFVRIKEGMPRRRPRRES